MRARDKAAIASTVVIAASIGMAVKALRSVGESLQRISDFSESPPEPEHDDSDESWSDDDTTWRWP